MTTEDKDLIANINANNNDTIVRVCQLLQGYDKRIHDYLATFVAHLCNIKTSAMFSDTHDAQIAQARWLFWCAYRYLTNDTYKSISKTCCDGAKAKKFTQVAIRNGVIKMHEMIEREPIWAKRWAIIKHIIKSVSTDISEESKHIIDITVSNTFGSDICVNGVTIKNKEL